MFLLLLSIVDSYPTPSNHSLFYLFPLCLLWIIILFYFLTIPFFTFPLIYYG
jgi:hypothetical protein